MELELQKSKILNLGFWQLLTLTFSQLFWNNSIASQPHNFHGKFISFFFLPILLKNYRKNWKLVDSNTISQQARSTTIIAYCYRNWDTKIFSGFNLNVITMLNNLISNLHHYKTPKARETTVTTLAICSWPFSSSEWARNSACQLYKPVWLLVRICNLQAKILDKSTDWSTYKVCRATQHLKAFITRGKNAKSRKTVYHDKIEVEWQP